MATKVQRNRSQEVLGSGLRVPYIDGATVAAIQTVFNRARLSHQGWEGRQLHGRLDTRAVWRSDAKGNIDIFRDRHMPSPTRLDVHILVDASGSMYGARACRAQDMAGTLVKAFERIPTVRLHVWQHNASGGVTNIYRLYEPGQSPDGMNRMLYNIAGGNADGFALEAIGMRAAQAKRPDTGALVILISDGLPSVTGIGASGNILDHSALVTHTLKGKGVSVLGVAVAGDVSAHRYMYGEGNTVNFNGDWAELSREFAAVFGTVLRKGAKT
jgi:hypothetical protein